MRHVVSMRPRRINVGEVRAEECLDLLLALNAGLPGMCTLPLLAGENMGRLSVFSTAQPHRSWPRRPGR
jgi:pilus assembly protein CpaF